VLQFHQEAAPLPFRHAINIFAYNLGTKDSFYDNKKIETVNVL
jgi:hypothetical protein